MTTISPQHRSILALALMCALAEQETKGRAQGEQNSEAQSTDTGKEADATQPTATIETTTEIPADLAYQVGLVAGEGLDTNALEMRARAQAAALIMSIRELGNRPASSFKDALTRASGMRYAEDSVLAAIYTFNTLAK